jgi:hypothetical protein
MSRRPSLPGAAELFRTTSPASAPAAAGAGTPPATDPEPAPVPESAAPPEPAVKVPAVTAVPDLEPAAAPAPARGGRGSRSVRSTRRVRAAGDRVPSGRERHEEKITVYCSPEELLDLETARLHLRAEHGMAVDRGRIVREAVAVVLADLEAKGDSSILVRRLRES